MSTPKVKITVLPIGGYMASIDGFAHSYGGPSKEEAKRRVLAAYAAAKRKPRSQ